MTNFLAQLAEAERLEKEATKGPWRQYRDEDGILVEIAGPCLEHHACRKTVFFRPTHSIDNWQRQGREAHEKACCCEGNAAFWTHARAFVPAACRWLRTLLPLVGALAKIPCESITRLAQSSRPLKKCGQCPPCQARQALKQLQAQNQPKENE